MIGKYFELLKDKLFDLCYEIIWMKKWMLAAFICIGLICFQLSYHRYKTVLSWANVPPRDELQQVNGRLLRFDRRKGGVYDGPDCLEIMLEDGSKYYVMNALLKGVVWFHMYENILPGDSIELYVYRFDNDKYEPRVVEISGENYCALSYEQGKSFYNQDAQNIKDEPKWFALAGVIFCMYGIIFLAIQHWLSK